MTWKAMLTSIGAALVICLGAATAQAATVTTWDGNGADNLPCEFGGHWVLSPAQGITEATLTVNGVTYVMTQNGDGSFAADSTGSLDSETTASASYEGDNDTAFLKLSHCETGESPSPTVTPSPSDTPSPSVTETPSPSVTHTGTPTPTKTRTGTSTPPTKSHTSSKPVRRTAFTGSNAIVPGIAAALLALLGGTLYLRNRKPTS